MVCGGLWWFAVVCGGLWWIAVVCLLVIPNINASCRDSLCAHTPVYYVGNPKWPPGRMCTCSDDAIAHALSFHSAEHLSQHPHRLTVCA